MRAMRVRIHNRIYLQVSLVPRPLSLVTAFASLQVYNSSLSQQTYLHTQLLLQLCQHPCRVLLSIFEHTRL